MGGHKKGMFHKYKRRGIKRGRGYLYCLYATKREYPGGATIHFKQERNEVILQPAVDGDDYKGVG